jgi:hypothetical protein
VPDYGTLACRAERCAGLTHTRTGYVQADRPKLIGMHLYDCAFDEKVFEKFVASAFAMRATYPGVETSGPQSMNNSLEELLLSEFLRFLHYNKLIAYTVKTDGNMDPNDIDQRLLDDLF